MGDYSSARKAKTPTLSGCCPEPTGEEIYRRQRPAFSSGWKPAVVNQMDSREMNIPTAKITVAPRTSRSKIAWDIHITAVETKFFED